MAPATAGTRPKSHRGGSSRRHLAYDLGYRGEELPGWAEDNPALQDAWEDGVSDRDKNGGDTSQPGDKAPRHLNPVDEYIGDGQDGTPKADAGDTPHDDSAASGPSSSRFAGVSTPGWVTTAGDSIGSAILGLALYAAGMNLVRGTFKQWVAAKFTNGDGSLP